jgi:hypothetical protein
MYANIPLGCSHKFMSQVFRPKTELTTYSSLTANTPFEVGKYSTRSDYELTWTVLDLHRSPPHSRCCTHCNPGLLSRLVPSNRNDPRLVKFACNFLHPFPEDPPPTRPPSQASGASDGSQLSHFEPMKGSHSISQHEKDHLRDALLDWRDARHRKRGQSCLLSPEIALPPKLVKKLVNGSGAFLKAELIGRREILKVITWDFATPEDFEEVSKIIHDWRVTITVSDTPASQRRARKKNRTNENTTLACTPQPVFAPGPPRGVRAKPSSMSSPCQAPQQDADIFGTPRASSTSTSRWVQVSTPCQAPQLDADFFGTPRALSMSTPRRDQVSTLRQAPQPDADVFRTPRASLPFVPSQAPSIAAQPFQPHSFFSQPSYLQPGYMHYETPAPAQISPVQMSHSHSPYPSLYQHHLPYPPLMYHPHPWPSAYPMQPSPLTYLATTNPAYRS